MNLMDLLNWYAEHPALTIILILSIGVMITIARNGR